MWRVKICADVTKNKTPTFTTLTFSYTVYFVLVTLFPANFSNSCECMMENKNPRCGDDRWECGPTCFLKKKTSMAFAAAVAKAYIEKGFCKYSCSHNIHKFCNTYVGHCYEVGKCMGT